MALAFFLTAHHPAIGADLKPSYFRLSGGIFAESPKSAWRMDLHSDALFLEDRGQDCYESIRYF